MIEKTFNALADALRNMVTPMPYVGNHFNNKTDSLSEDELRTIASKYIGRPEAERMDAEQLLEFLEKRE